MSNYSQITLQDAALFSALSYAPAALKNSILWGLTQTGVSFDSAQALSLSGWSDQTQPLLLQYSGPDASYFSAGALNEFRVYVNTSTKEVVFAFKGSSNNTNFASDFVTNDQGYSQYSAIEAAATSLYATMSRSAQYSSYTFTADGHSLGGGMAQTFALQEGISGFAQNSLPIAYKSITNYIPGGFAAASAAYAAAHQTFTNLALQGDLANALYSTYYAGTGSQYLGTTSWLPNPGAQSEYTLAADATNIWTGLLPAASSAFEAAAIADAISAHKLATFIPITLATTTYGMADSLANQGALASLVAPVMNSINAANLQFNANGTISWPASIFGSPIGTALSVSPTLGSLAGLLGDLATYATNQTGINIVSGAPTQLSALLGGTQTNLLVPTLGLTQMVGGTGPNVFIGGGVANTTAVGGSGTNTFEYYKSSLTTNVSMTIEGERATDFLFVGDTQITGATSGPTNNQWTDGNGTQYTFSPGSLSGIGTLAISNGLLGSSNGNQIVIDNFDLSAAETSSGYLGIHLPAILMDPPALNFDEGSTAQFTLSVDAPSSTAQNIAVSLSGAIPSDFDAIVGNTVEQINANGTFNVVLPAQETSVSFALIDTTADNGASDISGGATLSLTGSLPNPDSVVGGSFQTAFTVNYIPTSWDTDAQVQPSDTVTGVPNGGGVGVTQYSLDGNDDYVATTGPLNSVVGSYSGNDSIVGNAGTNVMYLTNGNNIVTGNYGTDVIVGGNGANEIYGGAKTSIQNALVTAGNGTATGAQGDVIGVGNGNNTVVGSNGNDLLTAGEGSNLVIMGPGNDTFYGGFNMDSATPNWSDINGFLSNVYGYDPGYANTYAQPYYGNSIQLQGSQNSTVASSGSDTVFGGRGNDLISLGNGNNYVDMGSGNSTVQVGMGNNTVIGGTGADEILGGGGSEYILGGSGNDSIYGGDGSNTIIGGSGNSTIFSSDGPSGLAFANASLDNNYVDGGSGNDVIWGSGGSQDTLIAGTGNTSIYGQSGADNIVGGTGNDLLQGSTGNTTITAGGAGVDTLYAVGSSSSTSILYGGAGRDYIEGGSGTNTLFAGDGGTAGAPTTVIASQSDSTATTTIYGGLGVDLLQGGSGSSVLYGGDNASASAPSTLIAGSGNTTIYGGIGPDFIQGGTGNDVLFAGDGGTANAPTTVNAGTGVATLYGGGGESLLEDNVSGNDVLESANGNDTLIGFGSDTLIAGAGNDVLQINSGSITVSVNAGVGNDTVYNSGGTENLDFGAGIEATSLTGAVAFDTSGNSYLSLFGDGSSISVEGALTGTLGSTDFTDTGAISTAILLKDAFGGDQTVALGSKSFFLNLTNNESVSTGSNLDTISSWGTGDTLLGGIAGNQELIYSAGDSADIASSIGADIITAAGTNDSITAGSTDADQITVSGGNALVTSISGRDSITASGTNDTINASSGNSRFYINNASTVLNVTGTAATDQVVATVSYTAPTNVNTLTLSGTANIVGTGNAGADTLTAGAGQDTLVAGAGVTTMYGGTGNTTFVLNNTSDFVQDLSTTTSNTIEASVNFTLVTNVNSLVLTGTAALTGTANSANDTLISNSGVDTLYGGKGTDTFVLNNSADVVVDTLGTANIVYASSSNFTLPSTINTLALLGTAAIVATGNSGNDSITANSGADTLIAGSGTDTLVSGSGTAADSLVAGTGNDLFIVTYSGDQVAVGATHGPDTIESSVSYTASTNVTTLALIGTSSLAATGNSLADVLSANSGVDTLTGVGASTTLVGGSGNDTFVVNSTSDVVSDTAGGTTNVLSSSVNYSLPADVNSLALTGTSALIGTANASNDTLTSNSGLDTLVGGAGNDVFVVNVAGDLVQDTFFNTASVIQSSANFTLPTNINSLVLTGTAALQAAGNSANDLISANAGADTLSAGAGNDTLVSGTTGADSLVGGAGNDLFIVNYASDTVTVGGTHGNDTIQSSLSYTLPTNVNALVLTGSANLIGTAVSGNNSITGNAGSDTLQAGSGTDTLVAGGGVDQLIGGSGTDTFVINSTADSISGITGSLDEVYSSVSYSMAANLYALVLTGTANLEGTGNSSSNNIVDNGSGNNTLIAGSGAAVLDGGAGADVFVVNSASDSVIARYGNAVDTIESSVSYTLPTGIAVLQLTGSANLVGAASSAQDSLIGNAGLDTLTAGSSSDTLIAGSGLATMIGGAGDDLFVVNNSGDVVQDSLSGYHNILDSSATYTLPTNVNVLTLTGSANVVGTANSGNDFIEGDAGTDTLIAGSGTDTLVAGSGVDTLIGGSSNDTYVVDNTMDVIQSASSGGVNILLSSVSYTLPTNVNLLTLTGIANSTGTGNAANDTLIAGAGQDTLVAGSGNATLVGGSGNDSFVVNSAGDVVQDSVTSTSNTIDSAISYSLVANVNSLVLTGTSALQGSANAANDTLTSNSGVDTLIAGPGNDTFVINNSSDIVLAASSSATNVAQASVNYSLAANVNTLVLTGTGALIGTANGGTDSLVSNAGVDTLVGGSGNDTFVVANSADVIQDTSSSASNAIQSSVSYTLPTNVNVLTLTGSAALAATGNAAADVITANAGTDTLTAGAGVATLVGGNGNDTFVVNSTSDVVQDTFTSLGNTIQSSVSYSLSANVANLLLAGTAALIGTANSINDTLISNSGVDTLIAGSGHDLLIVNNSADVLQGVTANDTIESSVSFTLPGTLTNLVLLGTSNLTATGSAGSDTLTAGAGNDTLIAGSGTATFVGGSDNDTFVVNSYSDVIVDSSTTSSNTVQSSASFSLPTNVDSLTLTGTSALSASGNGDAANVITANSGNDLIVGNAFSNTLTGGAGSDTIDAGPEINLIYAGNGGTALAPTYVYGNATNTNTTTQSTIYGGSGTDVLEGGPGSDLIYAGTGIATLAAGTGVDSLFGAAGDLLEDSLSGYSVLTAGSGAETLSGYGADTLIAGSGSDVMSDVSPSSSSTTFEFAPGFGQTTVGNINTENGTLLFATGIEPTSLTVAASVVSSYGTANDIALILNDGASSIVDPGAFSEQFSPTGTFSEVDFVDTGSESFGQFLNAYGPGTQTLTYGASSVLLSTGNNQTVTGNGNDVYDWVYGNNDVFTQSQYSSGTAYIYGSNSTVNGVRLWVGGSGDLITEGFQVTLSGSNDTLDATTPPGAASTYIVENASDVISASAISADSVESFVSYTLPSNILNLILESSVESIVGYSNAVGGSLVADGSYDTLIGGAGADSLTAAYFYDVLQGGAGAETYILDSATDSIVAGSGAASLNSVQIDYSGFNYSLGAYANNLTLNASGRGTGNSANDSLTATSSYDTLVAGSGQDTLSDASAYAVTMIGGAGSDTFVVQKSTDVIQDSSTTTNNIVLSSVSYTLPTNVNTLVLTGASNVTATGNSGNDSLIGNAGNDSIVAGSGNDTLVAGSGTDTFAFNSGFGNDQVENAQHGDVIQFGSGIAESSLTFTALAGTGGIAPSLVIAGYGGSVTVQGGLVPGAISSIDFTGGSNYTVPQLVAPSGRTTVTGANGNLILSANNSDTVTGGSGQDTVVAWGNNDTLNAGTGGTVIYAGGNDDKVTGSSGTDNLYGIGTANTLIGGSGNETFTLSNASTVVQVSAGVGHDTVLSSVSYTIPANVSAMTMIGTAALVATGNANSDVITGNSNADTLIAGSGVATLVGNSSNDVYEVNNSSDMVQASAGATNELIISTASYSLPTGVNILKANASNILITANSGNDEIYNVYGTDPFDTLVAGSGNDTIEGYEATIDGGSGQDTLEGSGYSQVHTGTGVDVLTSFDAYNNFYINNSADVISNLSDYDQIYSAVNYTIPANISLALGAAPAFSLTGTANLTATALGSVVQMSGGGGNDTLISYRSLGMSFLPGTGITTEIGEAGANTFDVNNAADVVIANANPGNVLLALVSYTLPTNVTTFHVDGSFMVGTGNTANDSLVSYGSTDTLVAGAGNDTLVSTIGTTTMIGGAGNDVFFVVASTDSVSDSFTTTSNTVSSIVSFSLPTNVNTLILTGTGALTGTANSGYDSLTSNSGVDTLVGGSGNETFYVNDSADVVTDTSSTATNAIYSTVSYTLPSDVNVLVLTGSAAAAGTGNGASDTLIGNSGADTLTAGTGVAAFVGGTGNDLFVLNNAGDTVTVTSSTAADTISSTVNYTLPANVTALVFQGTAALQGTANAGNDTLTSNTGADTLLGGAGNDTFLVNNGSDVITDTISTSSNAIVSTASYTLPTDVNALIFTGTAALKGTANSANDTLTSNTGVDTLVGGSGSETFIVNNSADVIIDTSATSSNSVLSTISYTLPTNVNSLTFTGTAALTGTANLGNDTLTSNAGADTLVGSSGNETFFITNSGVVVTDTSATAANTISSIVSYTLPTDVNSLLLTGTAALAGTGNGGNDTLVGNSGADTLTAGAGGATLIGGAGSDLFVVTATSDVVTDTSSTASNVISSSASYTLPANVNTLIFTGTAALKGTANNANDTLTSNSGVDTLVGGAGNDTFVINNSAIVVSDTASAATNVASSSVNYTLAANVNSLIFTGTAALVGTGNSGNDTLTANSGSDTLVAGSGLDTLISGLTGADSLVGGSGNDLFLVNNAADLISNAYGTSSDTISSVVNITLPTNVNSLVFAGTAALVGTGNSGNDILTANTGSDTLIAGSGSDTLMSGLTGADSLVGGSGNDLFYVNTATDHVIDSSSTANNTVSSIVSYTLPTDVNTLIFTGTSALVGTANSGNDSLVANSGNDTFYAEAGADTLVSGATGTDYLYGGTGNDFFFVNTSTDSVSDTSTTTSNTVSSIVSYTLPTNVNTLILTGTSALAGTGNAGHDTLTANSGADTLTAGSGVATLIGGSGNDLFVLDNTGDVVTDTASLAANMISSTVSFTLPTNVNTLTFTGASAVLGVGNSANDSLTANLGSDTLKAGSGTDTLVAGTSGADSLVGGTGNDWFFVNYSADVVSDTVTTTSNTISSIVNYTLPTNVNTLVLTGTSALSGTGNGASDTLTANSGADTLAAGAGIATLMGGAGNDTFVINNASDVIVDTASAASNKISSTVSYTLSTNVNSLVFTGIAALVATANSGNDSLTANTGADTLVAGAGTDTLVAATSGADSLVGGTGNDLFFVNYSGDIVTDASNTSSNAIFSTVTYTLPTNVNALTLTGAAALAATGNAGSDILTANSGADTLTAGSGVAMLIGGTGNDLFVVNNVADTVIDNSLTANDTISSSSNYTLAVNVNSLILTGTAALIATGNAGNDTLTSNSGADTLVGGSGNDVFVLTSASDVVTDTSTTTTNRISTAVSYTLPTNVNVLVFTGATALTGTANSGNDSLTANTGADTLIGGAGNDTFYISSATDVVADSFTSTSNTVSSTVNYTLPTNVNTLVFTGASALSGLGNGASDTLTANTGADTLTAGNGLATLIGGSGNDTFVLNNAGDVVIDTSTTASNTISTSVNYTLPTDVNALILTSTANVGAANSGNDTLTAGAAIATLVGGSGNDTFVINNASDVVVDTSNIAHNTISSTVSYTLPTYVNALTFTGTAALTGTANSIGSDTLTSNTGIDTLNGGYGTDTFVINNASDVIGGAVGINDAIVSTVSYTLPSTINILSFTGASALKGTANSGNDTLTANTGADTLYGGAGNDTFVIDSTSNVVSDTSPAAINTVLSSVNYTLPTDVNSLVFTGTAALSGTGNGASDVLTANSGADTLTAGSGLATLIGGSGNNLFVLNNVADVVTDAFTTDSDTISSSVNYTLPTNVNSLILTGGASQGAANSGNDTLTAGGAVATLAGGSGNDAFVLNNSLDVVTDTAVSASNTISSTASYTLPTNVNSLLFTGTSALVGTANGGNDSLTANTGNDTLVAGTGNDTLVAGTSGSDSLVGGAGNDVFVVKVAGDVVTDTSATSLNTISSIVSYTLPTDVNTLVFTGASALVGTANAGNDSLVANTGSDTLIAGAGTDTLVSGSTGVDSLVGGVGNNTFFVNYVSDVVKDTSTTAVNSIVSTVSYTLPTDVEYLTLSGTAALSGTGNSLTDLIVANSGNDTITAGTGIAALEGGKSGGTDQIKASSNQAALIAGGGASTLTGGAYKDFFAAGEVSDSITTGATANVVSVNQGDGATALQATTSANNVLSLGAGIDTENLYFSKSGNNLVLTDGTAGDSITFTNWYLGSSYQDYTTLQVIEAASASYNSAGSDPLRNEAIEEFNLTSLVSAFNAAGSPANWALSHAMASAQIASSSTADYGGDLAYYFGLNGNLTGVDLSDVSATLTNSSFGTGTQTINAFGGISGGGGLQLLAKSPGISPITAPSPTPPITVTPLDPFPHSPGAWTPPVGVMPHELPPPHLPIGTPEPRVPTPRLPMTRLPGIEIPWFGLLPRFGLEDYSALVMQARADFERTKNSSTSEPPKYRVETPRPMAYVDPISVAWATMHGRLDQITEQRLGGTEALSEESTHALDLLVSAPHSPRLKGVIRDADIPFGPGSRRAP